MLTAQKMQQINFTANLDRAGNTKMFFIIEEAKETILDYSQKTVTVLWMCSMFRNIFCFNIKWHNIIFEM